MCRTEVQRLLLILMQVDCKTAGIEDLVILLLSIYELSQRLYSVDVFNTNFSECHALLVKSMQLIPLKSL
jgi:hypothetical protein